MKTYIKNFIKRDGLYVFFTTIISRLLSFLASWIALQFIENDILGIVLYAWNIITFLIPLVGLGLPQSLIRYGALANANDKKSLLHYVVKNGTFSSIILAFIASSIALLLPFDFNLAGIYTAILSIVLIPFFWLETIKIQLRLSHNNKGFSIVDVTYNIILCLLVLVLSFVFQEKGYIAAILIAPTLTSLIFSKTINIKKTTVKTLTITNIEFWKYGVFGGLSNVVTILLFAIDILLIGSILKSPEEVTAFRYISLVPFSLLFLPRTFIATDFVSFTEKITSKEHIKNYIKNYMQLFIIISILLVLFFYFFASQVLQVFDEKFIKHTDSFIILNIGICGILIFRGIFGNLLSSIGLVKANFYITFIAVILNYFTNKQLIPLYGIKGAAITSASLMWFTGISSMIVFYIYYKKFLSALKKT